MENTRLHQRQGIFIELNAAVCYIVTPKVFVLRMGQYLKLENDMKALESKQHSKDLLYINLCFIV